MKKNRFLSILLACVLTTGIMMTGCGQDESSETGKEQVQQETGEPAGTAAGKEQPDTAKEDAQEAENGTQAAGEYNFAFVLPEVHPYYDPFPDALAQAEKDFGIPAPKMQGPAVINQEDQNRIIDAMVAQGVNGIAMMPTDSVAANEKIAEVIAMGIPVVGFAGAPEQPTDMIFCLATDVEESAYQGTKALIEAMGEKGNIVHIAGVLSEHNTTLRMQGVKRACEEYENITLLREVADADKAETAQNAINSLMASQADEIDGIIATGYHSSVAVANSFRQLDEKRIKAIGCDTDPIVLEAIKDGYMTGTMCQNPWGQAYLCDYALKKFADGYTWKSPETFMISSGFYLLNNSNMDQETQLAQQATEALMQEFDSYFQAP